MRFALQNSNMQTRDSMSKDGIIKSIKFLPKIEIKKSTADALNFLKFKLYKDKNQGEKLWIKIEF